MKIYRALGFLLLFAFLAAAPAFAMEFSDVDFVDATLLEDTKAKFISHKKDPDLKFYISANGRVEMMGKQGSVLLFENTTNPVLVYRITAKKPDAVFYAVFDRSISHSLKTEHFKLVGPAAAPNGYRELLSLDDLKNHGWTAEGLQMRVEKKKLYADGITRSKSSPDNHIQSFLLTFDDTTGQFKIANMKDVQEAEDAKKMLKDEDFTLAGLRLGDNISKATEKYGAQFKASETTDETTKQTIVSHTYSRRLQFKYDKADGIIREIRTSTEQIATPRGITTGMDKDAVIGEYGSKFTKVRESKGVNYVYAMRGQYPDSSDMSQIGFLLNEGDNVIHIFIDNWGKTDI